MFKTHKFEIEQLFQDLKDLNEDYRLSKKKILQIEDSMPVMIREMINYCLDQKLETRLENVVTRDEFKEKLSYKLDLAYFREFHKKLLEAQDRKGAEFKL